ncbi:MAG: RHS repeat-associated core domain-containing protein [Paludibacteraceae bacterium]|nr:RHS repeat-associated core domain-containing protein [Paludibacteraceae bacterium]
MPGGWLLSRSTSYIPYGEVFVEESSAGWQSPYYFNSKELDEETGLYYYGARYLNPTEARWLSVDPMWEKYAGMSPYNYCMGNPVKLVDLDGREGESSDAEPCPKHILGTPEYYVFRMEDYKRRTGQDYPEEGYYNNYGLKYAKKFKELRNSLSKEGQDWVDETMLYLQQAIENVVVEDRNVSLELNTDEFRDFAFKTHAGCYKRAGVALLPWSDLIKIGVTPLSDVVNPSPDPCSPGIVYFDFDNAGSSQMIDVGLHVFSIKYWNKEVEKYNNTPGYPKLQKITKEYLRNNY